jgi:hypothetical protein
MGCAPNSSARCHATEATAVEIDLARTATSDIGSLTTGATPRRRETP